MTIAEYACRENEHQELFHLAVDPAAPVKIHIPSPLGRLPYHVYARGPVEVLRSLDRVIVKVDVGGLMDENLELPAEAVSDGETWLESKAPGMAWRRLCTADVSRGNGTLRFLGAPNAAGKLDVLLCTWPRFVATGLADDWIDCQSDPNWAPSGVPLGGIGGGRVDICRDGRFRNFSMNNNQDAPLEDPMGLAGAYLAAVEGDVARDLASRPIVPGHLAAKKLEYDARFPQAILHAPEILDGLDVTAHFTGTLTPHDLKTSTIPGFLLRWTVTNRSDTERQVELRFGWPNLIGVGGGVAKAESSVGEGDGAYHHFSDPSGRHVHAGLRPPIPALPPRGLGASPVGRGWGGAEAMRFVAYTGAPGEPYRSASGTHLLAAVGTGAAAATEPQPGMSVSLTIAPGESRTADMALVTAMPHWIDSLGVDRGTYWQNHFADGIEMAENLLANADAIFAGTSALADHLADSTLPDWLVRRLSNCCYPLVTNSVLYRDGRFSINEGPTEMVGCYGTLDQRLAAHPATQLLFPTLNRQELGEFARVQAEDGDMNHDLGHAHLESGPYKSNWPDLTCSFVIQAARHAWSTGDREFEDSMYPRVVRALRCHAQWADAGRGVAQLGNGFGTSYDSYHYFATTGYIATLWIAALNICELWAGRRGDNALLAEIEGWREAAVKRLEADLWNGKYYDAYGNGAEISRKTCHAGQIAGQWFSRMLTGRDVLGAGRLTPVIDSLLTLNGSPRFVVPPDEAAADGSVGSDFGWLPYIEGFMLAAIASRGDDRLWPIWERMVAATYADGATPCDTRLMYIPETGAQTWGTYYMTAPASWLVYDAWLGFFYDAQSKTLRLRRLPAGRYPIVSPLLWATLDVAEGGAATLTTRRTFTDASIEVEAVEIYVEGEVKRTHMPAGSAVSEAKPLNIG